MSAKKESSAGGIVYKKVDTQYHWLLVQNTKSGKNYWGFPKGHVADNVENEATETAALREVLEEGGVQAKIVVEEPFTVEYMFRLRGELIKKKVHYFLMEYLFGDPKDHDKEVSEAMFLPEEKVMETLTFQNDRNAFLELKKLL